MLQFSSKAHTFSYASLLKKRPDTRAGHNSSTSRQQWQGAVTGHVCATSRVAHVGGMVSGSATLDAEMRGYTSPMADGRQNADT
jgi:hypothetical protein